MSPSPQPSVTLTLTEEQHSDLFINLFPGDGKEAVAFLLCGRRAGEHRHRLVVRSIHHLPPESYTERTATKVTWNPDFIADILDKAETEKLSVIKVHSHPTGYRGFSATDDYSDAQLLPCVHGWVEADVPHGSAVMLPSGEMFGRYRWKEKLFQPLHSISVTGPDLYFWFADAYKETLEEFKASHAQAFGQGTTELLSRLSITIVGCSGTGSIIIEQLVRLGVGRLILIDPDEVALRNLNRILNANISDVGKPKVDMFAEAIQRIGLGTQIEVYATDLDDCAAVQAVAGCDVVFGCMDSHRGRYILNRIATFYSLPYFDVGVRLDADEHQAGKIRQVTGSVQYLIPGMSSMASREKISMAQVKAEGLRKDDPAAYSQQVKEGYIKGAQESRPAVISVNMYAASLTVNDFLARLHPYREMPNTDIAEIEFCLSGLEIFTTSEAEMDRDSVLAKQLGKGDMLPWLGAPGLIR